MLKRSVLFLLALILALSFSACAPADGAYTLPAGLKTVFASQESLNLPALPDPVEVTSFTEKNGEISVQLSGKVPRLRVAELDFITGNESTIFTKKDADSAQAHTAGKGELIHYVILTWDLGEYTLERTYNNWYGDMVFADLALVQKMDPAEISPYTEGERRFAFDIDGSLLNETCTLSNRDYSLTRTADYDPEKGLTGVKLSWKELDKLGGTFLEVGTDRAGNLNYLYNQVKWVGFLARSQEPGGDMNAVGGVRTDCYNVASFDTQLRKNYPQVASLVSTDADLPAAPGPVPENARIWVLNVGDYLDSTVFVFVTEDPFFVLDKDRAVVNKAAKDINGNALKLDKRSTVSSPVFELPEVK